MKWFFRWLERKCKQASNEDRESDDVGYKIGLAPPRPRPIGRNNTISTGDNDGLRSNSTNFALYSANGGTVIELRTYDPTHDRNVNTLYVISSDKDLGEQLGQIITMEALKR